MRTHLRSICMSGILLLCLVTTACSDSTPPAPPPTPLSPTATPLPPTPTRGPVAAATVTAVDALQLPADDAFLSPDGNHIAAIHQNQLCLFTSAGLQERCATFQSHGGLDANSVRWSPDSTRLVLTEDYFQRFLNPDIWVLDTATGAFTDLTDDRGAIAANIDVAPHWSHDGTQILFLRMRDEGTNKQADLYTISAQGGTPTRLGALQPGGDVAGALDWSPDGTRIAYTAKLAPDDPAFGVWVANRDGSAPRHVLPKPPVTEVAFSADDRYVAALDVTLQQYPTGGQPSTRIVRVADGSTLPVDPGNAALWTAWSPTGSALAYLVRNVRDPARSGLYLTAEPGTPGTLIAAGEYAAPFLRATRMPTWSARNTLLLMTRNPASASSAYTYRLVHLGVR